MMDRIVALDEGLGYALVYPGVTQCQPSSELACRARPGDSRDGRRAGTSVPGSALERGITIEDRAAQVAGLEVVLDPRHRPPDGLGAHFPDRRVAHLSRWRVGTALDGLFCQSNLGLVT